MHSRIAAAHGWKHRCWLRAASLSYSTAARSFFEGRQLKLAGSSAVIAVTRTRRHGYCATHTTVSNTIHAQTGAVAEPSVTDKSTTVTSRMMIPVVSMEIMNGWMNETRRWLAPETLDPSNTVRGAIPQMIVAMERWLLQCFHPQILFLALQLLERIVQIQQLQLDDPHHLSPPPSPVISNELIRLLLQRYQELTLMQQNESLFPEVPTSLVLTPEEILPFSPVTMQMIYDASNDESRYDACHLLDFLLRHMIGLPFTNDKATVRQPTTEHCNVVLRAWSSLNDVVESSQRAGDLMGLMLESPQHLYPNLESHIAFVDSYLKEGQYKPGFLQTHLDLKLVGSGDNNNLLFNASFLDYVIASCCRARNVEGALDVMKRIQTSFRQLKGRTPMNPQWLEAVLQLAVQQTAGNKKIQPEQTISDSFWQLMTAQVDCAMGMRRADLAPTVTSWDSMLKLWRYEGVCLPMPSSVHQGPEMTLQFWLTLWNKGLAEPPSLQHFCSVMNQWSHNTAYDLHATTKAEDLLQFLLELSETNASWVPNASVWGALFQTWAAAITEQRPSSADNLLNKMDELLTRFERFRHEQLQKTGERVQPSRLYSILIGIWGGTGDPRGVEKAQALFQNMVQQYIKDGDKEILSGHHLLSKYVAALTRAGRTESAETTIREWMEQGLYIDFQTLSIMTKAWSKSKTPERAHIFLHDLLQQYQGTSDTILNDKHQRYVATIKLAQTRSRVHTHGAPQPTEHEIGVLSKDALRPRKQKWKKLSSNAPKSAKQVQPKEQLVDQALDEALQHFTADDKPPVKQRTARKVQKAPTPPKSKDQVFDDALDQMALHLNIDSRPPKTTLKERGETKYTDPTALKEHTTSGNPGHNAVKTI